jgi:hypothetical protein
MIGVSPGERNGASVKPQASPLLVSLDNAVVVIDGMTPMNLGGVVPFSPDLSGRFHRIGGSEIEQTAS